MKQKKQFRLYDIYRASVTNYKSAIKGIKSYYVMQLLDHSLHIRITFENEIGEFDTYCSEENELKLLVREVNKHLGNCRKPGKKKREV